MRILVTNDDGINAPGLQVLIQIARKLTPDVWVVAPETNQSGASHSLTLHEPLRCREVGERMYAVRGTPTDCVIMGVRQILADKKPDLVLSGVNRGLNVADDVTYSGTVAGAMEGNLLGIRSFAISQGYNHALDRNHVRYTTAEALAPDLIRKLLAIDLPGGTLLNINFPDRDADEVAGVKITSQGKRDQNLLHVDARVDGRGFNYYWLTYRGRTMEANEGTDLSALRQGYISVTPLHLDLTDRTTLSHLQSSIA